MEFIDLKTQYHHIGSSIRKRIQAVLDHGRYIMGPEIAELERELAAITGSRFCVACSSGTDALLIAMMVLGIKPGDEVITTPFTFIATCEMIILLGAKPVFADIDPETYNLNPEKVRSAISAKTKLIMPVSLYGQPADFDEINAVASEYGLPVIEDAAQSFGALYKGKHSCALSTIGCTSFFPSKPLGCYGDGGACFTDDEELATRMRYITLHGQDRRYHHQVMGINGRLDTIQAAVLLAKLECFHREIVDRIRIGARYTELLSGSVKTPFIHSDRTSVFAQYTIEVDQRPHVVERLNETGVPTAVHYPIPIHLQPVSKHMGKPKGSFPIAELAAEKVLSLPMHPYLQETHLQSISNCVKQAISVCV